MSRRLAALRAKSVQRGTLATPKRFQVQRCPVDYLSTVLDHSRDNPRSHPLPDSSVRLLSRKNSFLARICLLCRSAVPQYRSACPCDFRGKCSWPLGLYRLAIRAAQRLEFISGGTAERAWSLALSFLKKQRGVYVFRNVLTVEPSTGMPR